MKQITRILFLSVLSVIFMIGCAGMSGGSGFTLQDAIEQTASKIAEEFPGKNRVAIAAFESGTDYLSDYIIEELTGALFDLGIEVADRQNLPFVYRELDFQISGDVSDESAQSIGRFLAAELVISGQLEKFRGGYRYNASVVNIDKAVRTNITEINIINDSSMRNMVAALSSQSAETKTARYGVSEGVTPKSAGAFLDRGIMFGTRYEFDLAIADFTDAIRLNPDLSSAYSLRGRAEFASAAIVTGIEANFSGVFHLLTGWSISKEQEMALERAIGDYTHALRLNPDNVTTYIERGEAYHLKKDFDNAIIDFTHAIRLDSNNDLAYNNRGIAYLYKGNYDKAIADYNYAIKLGANFAGIYSNRGEAYSRKGDYEHALADYNLALKLKPDGATLYYNRGTFYYDKGDYHKAVTDFTQAIKMGQNFRDAYQNRGNAYRKLEEYDKAIADHTQVIKIDPYHAPGYYNRGNEYRNKLELDSAILDYNEAVRLKPDYYEAYYNRGLAYFDMGDDDQAIADYTEAIRLNPNDSDYFVTRGYAYSTGGNLDKAIADYEAAIKINPNNHMARNNLEIVKRRRNQR